MDFLKPTDNLYKFMGVGGIVLAISCIIFPVLFFQQTSMEYLAQLRSSDNWQVHERFTTERLTTLDIRKRQAADEKNKLQAQLDKLNSGSNAPGSSDEVDKLESRIKEVNRQIESIEDSSHELNLDLALRRANAKYEETVSTNRRRDSRVVLQLGLIAAIICCFVSFIGFWHWWKRLRRFRVEEIVAEAQLQAKTEPDNTLEQATLEQATLGQAKLEQAKLEQATPPSRQPK